MPFFHYFSNENQSTGNDVTHSSQMNSPRRLTKQSAFESPTNDVQSNAVNACSASTPFTTTSGKDSILTQRQRLRKTGPFVVQSQSIADSRIKYAGSWAPPAYDSDSENNHAAGPHINGQKQVNRIEFKQMTENMKFLTTPLYFAHSNFV